MMTIIPTKTSGSGSKAGCMCCNCMKGVSRKTDDLLINKIVFIGHRCALPFDHPFRFISVSKECCPAGYYDGTKESVLALGNIVKNHDGICADTEITHLRKKTIAKKYACDGNTIYRDIDREDDVDYSSDLFNRKWALDDFSPYMWFAHMDIRKGTVFARRPDSEFDRLAGHDENQTVVNNNDSSSNDEGDDSDDGNVAGAGSRKKRRKKGKNKAVKGGGCHGRWVYADLPSATINSALPYDAFHAITNMAKDILKILKGETKGTTEGSFRLCAAEGRFPMIRPTVISKVSVPVDDNAPIMTSEAGAPNVTNNGQKKKGKKSIVSVDDNEAGAPNVTNNGQKKKGKKLIVSVDDNEAGAPNVTKNGQKRTRGKKIIASTTVFSYEKDEIPWCLSAKERKRLESAHNSIMIPRGLDGFRCKNILSATGNLVGHDKIQFLLAFMNFDLSFTDLPIEYRNMFAVISEVMADMYTPILSSNDSEENSSQSIFNRVIEVLCLFEAMLPDADQQFTHHQLLDVAYCLRKFGPMRNWWAFAGERFMKIVKDYCPQGGLNPVKTIYDYYARDENCQQRMYSTDGSKYDSAGRYCDNMIKLCGPVDKWIGENHWNLWLHDSLLNAIMRFIITQDITDIELKSPFYRIYKAFSRHKSGIAQTIVDPYRKLYCFKTWATAVIYIITGNCVVNQQPVIGTAAIFKCPISPLDHHGDGTLKEYIKSGCIYAADLEAIMQMRDMMPKNLRTKVIIKGIKFACRGKHYTEVQQPKKIVHEKRYGQQESKRLEAANPLNRLSSTWHHATQYSSWCKINHWHEDKKIKGYDVSKMYYGQLNYGFRLDIIADSVINNLCFLNVATRRPISHPEVKINLPKIPFHSKSTNVDGQYEKEIQFVCANYIESTNVGICCVNKDNVPILPTGLAHAQWRKPEHSIDTNLSSGCMLHLIDLHPQRRFVDISLDDSKLQDL